MKRLVVLFASAAIVAAGCSSCAAPGADDVLKQTEKAEKLKEDVEERNAELEGQP